MEVDTLAEQEDWRPVAEWPFMVSNWGRVRSDKGTVLQQYKKGRWGHLKVCLFRNRAQKRGPDRIDFPVHRLVAQAFVANPDNLPEVRHRNGIAWDNRPSNLIWGTSAENREDMRRHGTGQGAHASQAKVDWPIVTYMRECSESDRNLAAKFEVSRELVRDIRAFKKWVPGTPEQQRIQDEIVFLRHVDAKMMRLMKLDDAVPVEQTLRRKGAEAKVTVMLRERRFAQLVNGISLVYFKEFGAKRDLNKKTGTWAPQNMRLPAADRATEIIHFTALPDAHTPYGVPRWINQLPSVLGSRKAEEFNLEFFDNGGVPPMLIVLQGGTLQAETRAAVEQKMSRGSAASKNRVQVLEVEPTGGSLDSPARRG